jgi:hypothetical protein
MAKNEKSNLSAQLTELQTHYDGLACEEPPKLIDQAVLNLAKRELETQQARRKKTVSWISALSTVSLLVITLSMVMQQQPGSPPAPKLQEPVFKEPGLQEKDAVESNEAYSTAKRKQRSAALKPADSSLAAPAVEEQKQDIGQLSAEMSDAVAPASSPAPSQASPVKESVAGSAQGSGQRQDSDDRAKRETETQGAFENRNEPSDELRMSGPLPWLNEIQRLEKEGQIEKASEELKAFKLAYPDFELPPGLGE